MMDGKIMVVENVYRIKGTILVGRLLSDVKLLDSVNIKTKTGTFPTKILGMENPIGKLSPQCFAGESVVLLFRGISEIEIEEGDEVYHTGSSSKVEASRLETTELS